ncbi:IgG-binding virulence factor TspB family protein [Variovorax sp. Varisp36]
MAGGTYTPAGPTALQGLLEKAPYARIPGPALAGAGETSAAIRLGPGAARVLAGRVVGGLVPVVGVALGVAWLASNCFEKKNGQWVRTCGPGLETPPQSTGTEYKTQGWNSSDQWFPTTEGACNAATAYLNSVSTNGSTYTTHTCTTQRYSMTMRVASGTVYPDYQGVPMLSRPDTCPAGWYKIPEGCVAEPPPQVVTPQQIEDEMANKPLPPVIPQGVPYPLDPSTPYVFNPDSINPPNPQPLRVPQGLPRPVPNTNPQQYQQPVTRYVPAPTASEPTRLDAQPETVTGTSPTGITGPSTPSPTSTDGKEPEKLDLCKEHPEIIACQKIDFDTPDGEIPKSTKEVSFHEENLFGGGSCPADRVLTLHNGQTVKAWDWAQACQLMLPIRAVVMTLATFAAFLIVMPGIGGRST